MKPATDSDWLQRVTVRARSGIRGLPQRLIARNSDYITSLQNPSGGFPGPEGPEDLYYTSFALRCGHLLDIQDRRFWHSAAGYVKTCGGLPDVVSCHCFLSAFRAIEAVLPAWSAEASRSTVEGIADYLDRWRVGSLGFAKPGEESASLYHTFLGVLCCRMLGRESPDPDDVAQFVRSRRTAEGGFMDVASPRALDAAGVNPTAAAVQLLALCGALPPRCAVAASGFVVRCQQPDGGFAAWPGAPFSDLLSTFTALVTLNTTDRLADARLGDLVRFIRSLSLDTGGFRGSASNSPPDAEYTYYGLASLGLLRSLLPERQRGAEGGSHLEN